MNRIAPTTVALAAAAALAAGTTGLLSPAQAAPGRHQLPGSTPAWANSSHQVASTDGSTPVDFRMYLGWQGGDAAQKLAVSVSTPEARTTATSSPPSSSATASRRPSPRSTRSRAG